MDVTAEQTQDGPLLAAALRYAQAGIAVFPTRLYVRGDGRKGVSPISDWDAASTTDPEVIREWFTGAWRDAALCIDCGKSGVAGIDQDVTEGKNGLQEWEKLDPPATWRVRSPTGGAHDYYRADPEHPFTVDNTGAVADGVDVRGNGGFLFAPPSIDPRGGAWQWVAGEPDWPNLPMVPEVVIKRMEGAALSKRKRVAPAERVATMPRPERSGGSQLFASPSEIGHDFGPEGGYKTASAASALLVAELEAFTALTQTGSARSHILAQRLGVLAGHGVGVFWTYDAALATLMAACEENGFADANGYAYAQGQAERGLEYGMRESWVEVPESAVVSEVAAAPGDAVDALLAEMCTPGELKKRPAPQYLIKGLLNLDSESWIIGAAGSKKSFVVLDMAACIAAGKPWQGRKVHRGPVVYIAAEGAGGMGPRVKAWERETGEAMSEDVHVLPRPVQAADLAQWAVLIEACKRLEPVLVVLDTQARVTVGLEENSAKEMGVFTEAVRATREATGACVLPVHHTGRQGGDARGSSAIDGAQHTELKVVAEKGSLRGTLVSEKQKDMELAADVPLVFAVHEVGRDDDDEPITSLALVTDPFRRLAGTGDDPEEIDMEPWRGRQPEPWTGQLVAPQAKVKRRILQVLADHAGQRGLTPAAIRKVITDRWERVSDTGWHDSWTSVVDLDCVINTGGERFTLDRLGLDL